MDRRGPGVSFMSGACPMTVRDPLYLLGDTVLDRSIRRRGVTQSAGLRDGRHHRAGLNKPRIPVIVPQARREEDLRTLALIKTHEKTNCLRLYL